MKKVFLAVLLFFCLFTPLEAEEIIKKIEFADAAVLDVVQILAKRASIDLVISGDVGLIQSKRATINLKDITGSQAIEYILRTNDINYEIRKGAILISLDLNQDKGKIETVYLKYLAADKVCELIEKVIPSIKTTVGGSANAIVLKGKIHQIEEAKNLIESVDRPVPQILIESKVLEISKSDSTRFGVSYGSSPGVIQFITDKNTRKTALAHDISTTVTGLISDGKAKIIAKPRIATLDNHEAIINIGSRIPYAVPVTNSSNSITWTVDYIDAGVKLKITPMLGEEGYITTAIQPEVSSISEWKTTAAGEFPVISTRNAQATLRVKDGETIVIGGLLSETDRKNVSKLPILGYLPIVGFLFQNVTIEKAETEIVFMITPYVI